MRFRIHQCTMKIRQWSWNHSKHEPHFEFQREHCNKLAQLLVKSVFYKFSYVALPNLINPPIYTLREGGRPSIHLSTVDRAWGPSSRGRAWWGWGIIAHLFFFFKTTIIQYLNSTKNKEQWVKCRFCKRASLCCNYCKWILTLSEIRLILTSTGLKNK